MRRLPILLLLCATLVAQTPAPLRQPTDHIDRGLPVPGATWAPFARDAEHPANRVFRALYVAELVPAEIAAALPRERGAAADFFGEGWYFGKRDGTAADRRWFGGDGRQLPREGFTAVEAAAFVQDLTALDGDVLAALRATPRRAIYLQNDLLRLSRRLLDTRQNPELLAPLRAATARLGLPAATLQSSALATFALDQTKNDIGAIDPAALVAIDRRSTRLFDAEHSLLWSDVFVAVPGEHEATLQVLAKLAAAGKDDLPILPLGTTAVLVQGLVAVDDQGKARATEVVVDVRLKVLRNREPLARANPTSTHDGVDFAVWQLERAAAGDGAVSLRAFRRVSMDDQELFRDYGTLKHTSYAAHCSLCHRRSHAPDEPLAGFSSLRPSSKPRLVASPNARRRLAETQVQKLLDTLDPSHEGGRR